MASESRFQTFSLVLACCLWVLALAPAASTSAPAGTNPAGDERILHALNRLGFGPRPGDIERVRSMGLDAYIERQLEPQKIDDSRVDRRLRELGTLDMDPVELLVRYPPPQLLRGLGQRLTRRMGMDPNAVAQLFPEIERREQRKAERDGEIVQGEKGRKNEGPDAKRRYLQGPSRIAVELGQAKLLRAVESERQLQEVMTDFWFNHFNVFVGKGMDRWWISSYERDAIRPHALGKFRDLLGATASHPAMLFYLDNWLSSAPDATSDRSLMERYAVEAIREEKLPPGGVATLILRDRGMNTSQMEAFLRMRDSRLMRGGAPRRGAARDSDAGPQRNGLNENYARELLELHTLGVDGGYSQEDIVEVARAFTGWTLLPIHAGQQFVFVSELHDRGTRTVLGTKIKGQGMAQGQAVLDLVAGHPQTARHISTKLARRFVSDEPPDALVEAMAGTFLETDGDIREVLRTLFASEAFWSVETREAKVKTPFEFVVSVFRATDAEILELPAPPAEDDPMAAMSRGDRKRRPGALGALRELGMPLYGAVPPTGYKDTADAWISTGSLLQRFKLSAAIASDKLPGVQLHFDAPSIDGRPMDTYLRDLGRTVLGREPSDTTVAALAEQLDDARSGQARSTLALAWLLASPEFQRR